jgi:radical SAM superfamily enzyme YgiQ (UPF0313 family)
MNKKGKDIIIWTGIPKRLPQKAIGAYQIAHWVRQHGYTAQVIDHLDRWNANTIVSMTEHFIGTETVAIGLSATFMFTTEEIVSYNELDARWIKDSTRPTVGEFIEAFKILKARYPKIKFILGGATSRLDRYRYSTLFDIKLSGFAEEKIIDTLAKLKTSGIHKSPPAIFDITTASHRWHPDDVIQPGEALPIELGRGCIFKCKFCSYRLTGKAKGSYLRSMDCIKDEILDNYEKFGTTRYFLLDDTFNEDIDKITAWYKMSQQLPFKIETTAYVRADLVWSAPETAYILQEGGLIGTFIGVESFHPKASMAVGKGWMGKHGKEWLPHLKNNLWKDQMSITMGFIIGLPHEPEDSMYESQKWLIDNQINNWRFRTLEINLNSNDHDNVSEFEKDITKYGYSFPCPDNPNKWKTDIMDKNYADKIQYNMIESSRPYTRHSSWDLPAMLSLGYDRTDVNIKYLNDPVWQTKSEKIRHFLTTYKELLFKIKVD